MCIYGMRTPDPEEKQGIGYKIVRIAGLSTYLPQWLHFNLAGHGGCHQPSIDTYTTKVQYVLGKWYRVRHQHQAVTLDNDQLYRAGVHLYLEQPALWEKIRGKEVIIKCQYSQAVAIGWESHDHMGTRRVVVALAVKPLEEIK